MGTASSKPAVLKAALNAEDILVLPGVYNALSARQAQAAGFEAVYISGYAIAGAYLAQPDVGLVTRQENLEQTAAIVQAADRIPVIADVDHAYGNAFNVIRTIEQFEQAGVAGIDINDQVDEVCPHLPMMRELISLEEMCGRIQAIVETRSDPDFAILMKVSVKQTEYQTSGRMFEEFERRIKAYAAAGADAIICGWQPAEEYEPYARVVRSIGLPPIAVEVPFRPTPSAKELQAMGFAAVIHSVDTLYAAYIAHQDVYETIKRDGTVAALRDDNRIADHDEFMDMVRVAEIVRAGERYLR